MIFQRSIIDTVLGSCYLVQSCGNAVGKDMLLSRLLSSTEHIRCSMGKNGAKDNFMLRVHHFRYTLSTVSCF